MGKIFIFVIALHFFCLQYHEMFLFLCLCVTLKYFSNNHSLLGKMIPLLNLLYASSSLLNIFVDFIYKKNIKQYLQTSLLNKGLSKLLTRTEIQSFESST